MFRAISLVACFTWWLVYFVAALHLYLRQMQPMMTKPEVVDVSSNDEADEAVEDEREARACFYSLD
jgi:hypothetical protein